MLGLLELRAVTLRTCGEPVLDGVDITIPGDAVVAVVGRSGAGKSLVAALAGGLLDPDAGAALLASSAMYRDLVGHWQADHYPATGSTPVAAAAFNRAP